MSDISNLNFDASQVEPASFDVIPAGEYEAVIVASEMKPTTTGGEMLVLELQVLNGKYQNRKLWDRLNLVNSNDKAVQIAKGTLSAICRAVGVLTPKDSSELHNKPLSIKVAVQPARGEYGESNTIKSYKPRHTGPAPIQSAPVPIVQADTANNNDAPWVNG